MINKKMILVLFLLVGAILLHAEGTPGLRFDFIENKTAFEVSRGSATDTHIVIPSTHNGLPVRRIESSGFSGFREMTYISIPIGVTSIGNRTFRNCSGLTSITIPHGVTSIGIAAFDRCTGLTSVILPNSLITIGNFAFSGCSALTRVFIPNTVVRVGTQAFENCPNLTIYVEAEEQPSGWDWSWNPDNRPVVWGYVLGE